MIGIDKRQYLHFDFRQFPTFIVEVEREEVRAGQGGVARITMLQKIFALPIFTCISCFLKRRDEIMLGPQYKSNFSFKRKGKGATI